MSIVIGSPLDKKGITVSPCKIMFNGNNVKKMMKNDVILWIYEIKALIPAMTSNTTPSGKASSSSLNGSYYPWYAFDGNESTPASCSGSSEQYLQYDFDSNKTISKYSFTCTNPGTFKLQISTDGDVFKDIDMFTIQEAHGNITKNITPIYAKSIRFTCVSLNSGYNFGAREIQVYGD